MNKNKNTKIPSSLLEKIYMIRKEIYCKPYIGNAPNVTGKEI